MDLDRAPLCASPCGAALGNHAKWPSMRLEMAKGTKFLWRSSGSNSQWQPFLTSGMKGERSSKVFLVRCQKWPRAAAPQVSCLFLKKPTVVFSWSIKSTQANVLCEFKVPPVHFHSHSWHFVPMPRGLQDLCRLYCYEFSFQRFCEHHSILFNPPPGREEKNIINQQSTL